MQRGKPIGAAFSIRSSPDILRHGPEYVNEFSIPECLSAPLGEAPDVPHRELPQIVRGCGESERRPKKAELDPDGSLDSCCREASLLIVKAGDGL